jgi:hypothetical protein
MQCYSCQIHPSPPHKPEAAAWVRDVGVSSQASTLFYRRLALIPIRLIIPVRPVCVVTVSANSVVYLHSSFLFSQSPRN